MKGLIVRRVVGQKRMRVRSDRERRRWLSVSIACIASGWVTSRVLGNGGDTCATATVINALPFNDTGSTNGQSNDYDETCLNASGALDVVYSYTPGSDQGVTISLCTSSYDNFLYVYDTNCPGAVIGCNDDTCGTSGLRAKLVSVPMIAGRTYFIIVDGFSTKKGTFTIDVTQDFLSDHPAGQESNAFTKITNTTNDELFAFTLDPGGSSVTVTQTVFSLSDIVGLVDGDWSGIELVVDSNNDGNIGAGETTTVGGAGVVNQAAKTITFSTSFSVAARTSYILRSDFASLSSGDSVTIDLLSGNITGGPGTGSASTGSSTLIDLSNGLLGFWKLNDNTGTSATDSSGNARTGTLTSGPTWTSGIFSNAVNFDEVNDHILITDFSYGPDFTWTFWFKTDDNSGTFIQDVFSHGAILAQNSFNVYLIENSDILRTVLLDNNDTGNFFAFDFTATLAGTGWHSYALTVASGTGSKVYVDGILRASDATLGGDAFNPTTDIFLAARENLAADSFYGGRLDDVRLYNRALSLAEVQQLAKGHGLRAHWKFDDGSGTTATDSVGINNGTLTNGPTWTTGHLCGALDFDGTTNYVDVGDVLDVGDTDDLTIAGWFNRSSFTTDDVLIAKRTTSGAGADAGYVVFLQGAGDTLVFRADDGVDLFSMTSSTAFTAAGWNHFALVWDENSTGKSKIYINGVNDNATQSGTITAVGALSNASSLRIGALSDGAAGSKFDGKIDDIRVYNRALSASEIQALSARFQVIDLGSQNSTRSLGQEMNAAEQVVGFDSNPTTKNSTAWISRFCLFTTITPLAGGSVNEALAINAAGKVVGWSGATGSIRKAFLWTSGGGTTDLGLLSGRTDSEAFAINSSDEVVGNGLDLGAQPDNRLAFLNLPTAKYGLSVGMNSLGTLGGTQSVGMGLNDSGQVVGGSQDASLNMKPFIWLPSAAFGLSAGMNSLGTLGGQSSEIIHRAQAINSTGEVVGRSYTVGGAGHAFHWQNGTMTDMGTLTGGTSSWAFDINDSGMAVGTSGVTGGAFHAFLWDGTTMTDLNTLIDAASQWTLIRATGIDNDGEITGWGTNSRNETRAFTLSQTCTTSASAQSASALLADGSGVTDGEGALQEIGNTRTGKPLVRILVTGAESDETFAYTVTSASSSQRESLSAFPKPPGPGGGTFSGFDEDRAFDRTLAITGSQGPGDFLLTVRMTFTNDELERLGAAASDLQLHRFDPLRAMWTPIEVDVGESRSTGVLDESGFEAFADGTVDYWAVVDTVGIFAVGRPDPSREGEASLSNGNSPRTDASSPQAERPPVNQLPSQSKFATDDELSTAPRVLPPRLCGVGVVSAIILMCITLTLVKMRTHRH